jgi:O-antigen ligase
MNSCKKVIFSIFCFLIFLRPFISSKAFPKIENYYLIFLIVASIILIKKIKNGENSATLNLAFFFLTSAGILSLLFSPNKLQSLISLPDYFSGILFFLITLALDTKETKTILRIIIVSGLLISLYGIYQYLFGFSALAKYILAENPNFFVNHLVRNYFLSRRIFATFFSPNMLAGYLIMIIPITIGYIFEFRPEKKLISYLALGTPLLALVLTKSLGAVFSLAVSLTLFFYIPNSKKKNISLKKIWAYSATFLILFLIIIMPTIVRRSDRLFNFQNPHNSILQRINFTRLTLKIIKGHFLLGVGPGNFGDFYARYRGNRDIRTNYAHNFILQTQAELGILGSLGLILLLSLFLKDILSFKKAVKQNYAFLKAGLLCAGISFLLHNLIDISFFIPEVAISFWVGWASFKNLTKQKICAPQ